VCADEAFDVTPYARALSRFLLGHPDCQDLGRKFKPAFSGCHQHACGLVSMHDVGVVAETRIVEGQEKRGLRLVVGGGLGSVPYQAKLFDEFLAPEELLPITQAIARVFARLGEKKNRNRARIKFLVHELGIDQFKKLVMEERKILPHDARWTEYIAQAINEAEQPLALPALMPAGGSEQFRRWLRTNIRPQKQDGYVVATVTLPLGDITPTQLRALADIARRFTRETIRTTVEQNFVIRWVSRGDLPPLFDALEAVGLGQPGAGSIVDIVACPGTDTCKLGISSSRGLAAELRTRLAAKSVQLDEAIQNCTSH
jgi:sulfite reductase (ferredoxin)